MLTLRVPASGTLPALRRYLGLTQARMAALLGTSRMAVAKAEAGTRFLTFEAREALHALLAPLHLATRQALAVAPGYDPPPPPPPDAPAAQPPAARPLARRHHLATQELDRVLTELATHDARRAAGIARLALAAHPASPSALSADVEFGAEARLWTGSAAEAARRLLLARAAGLRAELAALAC